MHDTSRHSHRSENSLGRDRCQSQTALHVSLIAEMVFVMTRSWYASNAASYLVYHNLESAENKLLNPAVPVVVSIVSANWQAQSHVKEHAQFFPMMFCMTTLPRMIFTQVGCKQRIKNECTCFRAMPTGWQPLQVTTKASHPDRHKDKPLCFEGFLLCGHLVGQQFHGVSSLTALHSSTATAIPTEPSN